MDLKEKIEKILKEKIRPVLRQDGGDIRFGEIREDGTLVVIYMGRCSGCPAIEWTHNRIVKPAIADNLKDVKKIEWQFDL